MAKLAFSKLGLTKNTEVIDINFNNQDIEVKQYLPIDDKIKIVTTILNYVVNNNENHFANPIHIDVFSGLEIVEKYTNITFTDKQKSDPTKLYDLLKGSGLIDKIIQAIPKDEYGSIMGYVYQSINAYYNYENSVYGILDNMGKDYSNLEFDAEKIRKSLSDGENVEFLKEVLTKLG